jgi:hypothetical protein
MRITSGPTEMGPGAMICTPTFIKFGSAIQKLIGGYTDTQIGRRSQKPTSGKLAKIIKTKKEEEKSENEVSRETERHMHRKSGTLHASHFAPRVLAPLLSSIPITNRRNFLREAHRM